MGMNLSTEQKEVVMIIVIKQNKIVKASDLLLKAYPAHATVTQSFFSGITTFSLSGKWESPIQLVLIPEPVKIKCLDQKDPELRKVKLEVKK